jgi:hypothetical protein
MAGAEWMADLSSKLSADFSASRGRAPSVPEFPAIAQARIGQSAGPSIPTSACRGPQRGTRDDGATLARGVSRVRVQNFGDLPIGLGQPECIVLRRLTIVHCSRQALSIYADKNLRAACLHGR